MFAYIPARGGSKRIPRKNIRPLGETPIIRHVIENLLALDFIKTVHVSTDDSLIKQISEDAGAVCIEKRNRNLADDKAGFIDLIQHDIERYALFNKDQQVLFVLPTAALVPPLIYFKAYESYINSSPDILMSCEKIKPFWAMTQKSDGFWWPLFPEKVHTNSQELPKALIDAGLFYMFDLSIMKKYQSVKLANRIQPFEIPKSYCVDVDDEDDWSELEHKFQRLKGQSENE